MQISTKSNTKVKEDNKSSVKMPNLFPKPPVMGPLELRKEMAKNSLNKKISSMLLFRR